MDFFKALWSKICHLNIYQKKILSTLFVYALICIFLGSRHHFISTSLYEYFNLEGTFAILDLVIRLIFGLFLLFIFKKVKNLINHKLKINIKETNTKNVFSVLINNNYNLKIIYAFWLFLLISLNIHFIFHQDSEWLILHLALLFSSFILFIKIMMDSQYSLLNLHFNKKFILEKEERLGKIYMEEFYKRVGKKIIQTIWAHKSNSEIIKLPKNIPPLKQVDNQIKESVFTIGNSLAFLTVFGTLGGLAITHELYQDKLQDRRNILTNESYTFMQKSSDEQKMWLKCCHINNKDISHLKTGQEKIN